MYYSLMHRRSCGGPTVHPKSKFPRTKKLIESSMVSYFKYCMPIPIARGLGDWSYVDHLKVKLNFVRIHG